LNNVEMAKAYVEEALRRIKTAERALDEESYAYCVTSSPDLSRELPVRRDFIRHRPSRFAGSTPYGARFRRSACLHGVPASSAGSMAHCSPIPWISLTHGLDLPVSPQPTRALGFIGHRNILTLKEIRKYLSFSPTHPLTEVGGFWAPFL